jgi:Zn-finger nucleic acid-binding protein
MKCRHCSFKIKSPFLDLGNQPLANSLLPINHRGKEEKYPLEVFYCPKCHLVQIDKVVNQKKIFNKTYPYFSSYSKSWISHAKKYSISMIKSLNLNHKSFVIEIASNDGYLLKNFMDKKIPCLGIEPTKNTALVSSKKGIETISKFFSSSLAIKIIKKYKHPDLIIAKNVMAHVPNLNDFIEGLYILCNDKTTITVEFPHLLQLIKKFQYDTIYHEHFSYFSLMVLVNIFDKFGLKIFDVKELNTHGGSLRIYACRKNNNSKIKNSIKRIIQKERDFGLDHGKIYHNFSKDVESNRSEINKFLKKCKKLSKVVIAYGAAAKGNTLINYCKINSSQIKRVYDVSPHKQDKLMPGSKIRISNPDNINDLKPDYIIFLPWNLKNELSKQLSYMKKLKTKFVILIPKLNIF